MRRVSFRLCALAIMIAIAWALPASAHRAVTDAAPPEGAIVIPNLTHGQMAVIAEHRAEILDLAARQEPTDPTTRRLEGFINLQYFDCFWGFAPGSVEDEASPFNECAHAYLAATRALLVHMETMPGDRTEVRTLVARIEREMLSNNASLIMCRYSDEPFSTAERIAPHWSEIPYHLPSLMTFGGLGLAAMGSIGLGVGWRRHGARPSRTPSFPR
jgi:hypothetical protein